MSRFGVKEVADVTFYNLLTGKPDLFLDTLKLSNVENTAETVYAQGGSGNNRLIGWDFNRTVTFNIQDALLNPKAIAMQAGTEVTKQVATIYKREVKVAKEDTEGLATEVQLDKIPNEGSVTVYITSDGYEHGQEVTPTVVDQTLSFDSTELPADSKVLVYYTYDTVDDAEVIKITSDKFSGYYRIVGDTVWRNESNGLDEKVQIVIPKAKIISDFTLTMQPDGDPSVFDFNLDVFKEYNSTDMINFIRYQD